MANRKRELIGTHWGIKDGKIETVKEYFQKGIGATIEKFQTGRETIVHKILESAHASREVERRFGITHATFVPSSQHGKPFEQDVIDKLNLKLDQ